MSEVVQLVYQVLQLAFMAIGVTAFFNMIERSSWRWAFYPTAFALIAIALAARP